MKNFLKREPVRRGLRTFVQAAAAYALVHIADTDFTKRDAILALLAACLAAGIAAAMNIDADKGDK